MRRSDIQIQNTEYIFIYLIFKFKYQRIPVVLRCQKPVSFFKILIALILPDAVVMCYPTSFHIAA